MPNGPPTRGKRTSPWATAELVRVTYKSPSGKGHRTCTLAKLGSIEPDLVPDVCVQDSRIAYLEQVLLDISDLVSPLESTVKPSLDFRMLFPLAGENASIESCHG